MNYFGRNLLLYVGLVLCFSILIGFSLVAFSYGPYRADFGRLLSKEEQAKAAGRAGQALAPAVAGPFRADFGKILARPVLAAEPAVGPFRADFGKLLEKSQAPKALTPEMGEFLGNSRGRRFYLVNPNDISAVMKVNESALIVDVRTYEEYCCGRIPGAMHISLCELSGGVEKLPEELDSTIYVYCNDGVRGAYALASLRMLGYTDVYNLSGGFEFWKEAGFPVVRQPIDKKIKMKAG